MSLNFGEAAATPSTPATKQTDRPKSMIWLNIGVDVNGTFVNLPFGLPIDTMNAIEIKGSNQEWNNLSAARNALLEKFKQAGAAIEAGKEETIDGLKITLRHVGDVAQPEDANPFMPDFSSFGKKPVEPQVEGKAKK